MLFQGFEEESAFQGKIFIEMKSSKRRGEEKIKRIFWILDKDVKSKIATIRPLSLAEAV